MNNGDAAMALVTIEALAERIDDAEFDVFLSEKRNGAVDMGPACRPVRFPALREWRMRGNVLGRLAQAPRPLDGVKLEEAFRQRFPVTAYRLHKLRNRLRKPGSNKMSELFDLVAQADGVVAAGGGYLMDEWPNAVKNMCDLMALASSLGKKTALFGIGLGPLKDGWLYAQTRRVLRCADLICLRERGKSLALLRRMGVDEERVRITGDQAIRLASRLTPERPGDALGVNVRIAPYSHVGDDEVRAIGAAMEHLSRTRPLRPFIIRNYEEHADSESLSQILGPAAVDAAELDAMNTPARAIRAVGQCRAVVTGSYHGAVFALAQGVPAVALAKSPYYRAKMEGVRDMFGVGCRVVDMSESDVRGRLVEAAEWAWSEGARMREEILDAAERQTATAEAAYDDYAAMLAEKGGKTLPRAQLQAMQ
jgi:colanic acid/amylovoran biosynthesis protein